MLRNASFFKRLAALSHDAEGSSVALRIQTQHPAIQLAKQETKTIPDRSDGKVRWIGPGDCVVPPRGEVCAVCKVDTDKPLRKEIFVVDTPEENSLPAGTFITPVVLPSSAMEGRNIQVLIHNETSKDISIPAGTVMANVYPTDTLTVSSGEQRPNSRPKLVLILVSLPFLRPGNGDCIKSCLPEVMFFLPVSGMWD